MAANANIDIISSATYTKTTTLANYSGSPKLSETLTLSSSDISKVYSGTGTITTNATIDVSSLTDVYGAALAFGTVKGCVIQNTHASATIVIGGGTTPLFGTDQITLKAGHSVALTSPITVTTNINLKFTVASATYSILLLGS